MLLKSSPRDQKSIELVKERGRKQDVVDLKEEEAREKVRLEKQAENDARLQALRDAGQLMKVRKDAVKKLREKQAKKKADDIEIKKLIDEAEEEYQKEKKFTGKKKPIKFFSQPEKDEDYIPPGKKAKKTNTEKKVQDREIFNKLNKRFQEVVSWTKGEQTKVYGDDEWDRIRHYNEILNEGKALSKQMSQITKKKFKNMSYFNQFIEA